MYHSLWTEPGTEMDMFLQLGNEGLNDRFFFGVDFLDSNEIDLNWHTAGSHSPGFHKDVWKAYSHRRDPITQAKLDQCTICVVGLIASHFRSAFAS